MTLASSQAAMHITIYDSHIQIEERSLPFEPYYFTWETSMDYRDVVKGVMHQWIGALQTLQADGDAVYLPYNLRDDGSDAIKATLDGPDVILRLVGLHVPGHCFDLNNLYEQMVIVPPLADECTDIFGRYPVADFIASIAAAVRTWSLHFHCRCWIN